MEDAGLGVRLVLIEARVQRDGEKETREGAKEGKKEKGEVGLWCGDRGRTEAKVAEQKEEAGTCGPSQGRSGREERKGRTAGLHGRRRCSGKGDKGKEGEDAGEDRAQTNASRAEHEGGRRGRPTRESREGEGERRRCLCEGGGWEGGGGKGGANGDE
jgi:hypothetical protein